MPKSSLTDSIYKQLVETTWVAVVVADLNGIVNYANKSANELYGYGDGELIGLTGDDLIDDPDLSATILMETVMKTGSWSGELIQRKKDGTQFPVMLTIWVVKDEEGKPIGIASNSKDLSEQKEVDNKIKESEENLQLILNSLPLGLYILDGEGKPYFANEFTKIFAEIGAASDVSDLSASEEWEVFKRLSNEKYPIEDLPIMKALRGESSIANDLDIVINGRRYHVSVTGNYVKDKGGKIKFAISTWSDISEIVKQEAEMSAMMNAQDYYVISLDKDLNILRYNTAFEKSITQYFPGKLKQGVPMETFIHESERKETMEIYKRVFTGETVVNEKTYHSQNGNMVTYFSRYAPIYSNGEIFAVTVSALDITDRIKRENELKSALSDLSTKEDEIRAIINNTDAMILSIDREYRILTFNEKFKNVIKKSHNRELKRGDKATFYLDELQHQHVIALYKKTFEGEKIIDEFTYTTPIGDAVIETRYNPIVRNNGEINEIVLFSHDITERIQNNVRLENALKEKEFLLNEVHHRVKNNLAIVSSLLQLEELKTDNPEIKDILISSQNRIKSTALVHQFLYQNDSIVNIHFKQYVEEFIAQIKTSFLSDKEIETKVEGDEFTLDIEQAIPCGLILNELYTNSIKHAFDNESSPKIAINLKKKGETIYFEYLDNGKGLPESIQDSTTLGMVVVKTLVKQLRGDIHFDSNKGARFFVKFEIR